ncbi:MAG: molybdenum cofactor guanylyltransferase [Chloroflexota bacterium]|jgi:molybdopterin-guanine dinucleotide biosynthesis protein A|nr:molybdenum cofactor guanylyltransferase [Chloroflexota bacterium]
MTDPTATRPTVTGIVLAGGRASRFGGPKLDARIDGESLLSLATRAVAEVAGEVLIAGPALPAIAGLGAVAVRLVTDEQPFEGPLVAIAGALRQAHGALAIVVGGDMPRLGPSVLRAMLERLAADDSVDAVTLEPPADDQREPHHVAALPLALRVAPTLPVIAEAVGSGDRSIVRLLGRLRSIELPAPDWLALDPDGRTLLDVDRPSDIKGARRTDFR